MSLDPPVMNNLGEQQRMMLQALQKVAAGAPVDVVYGAAINLIANAVRQTQPTKAEAEACWDFLFGKGKTGLLDHYDSVTGRRRTIVPFTQVIRAAHLIDDDEIRG